MKLIGLICFACIVLIGNSVFVLSRDKAIETAAYERGALDAEKYVWRAPAHVTITGTKESLDYRCLSVESLPDRNWIRLAANNPRRENESDSEYFNRIDRLNH